MNGYVVLITVKMITFIDIHNRDKYLETSILNDSIFSPFDNIKN